MMHGEWKRIVEKQFHNPLVLLAIFQVINRVNHQILVRYGLPAAEIRGGCSLADSRRVVTMRKVAS